jgi:hypothetical protein
LTIAANAARVADFLIRSARNGDLARPAAAGASA